MAAKRFANGLPISKDHPRARLRSIIQRVTVAPWRSISIALSRRRLKDDLLGDSHTNKRQRNDLAHIGADDLLVLTIAARLKRCGSELRFVVPAGSEDILPPRPNAALIKATARAHLWKEKLLSGEVASIRVLAQEESLPERYVSRVLRLAFLAPDIIEAILNGHQPPDLDLERLLKGPDPTLLGPATPHARHLRLVSRERSAEQLSPNSSALPPYAWACRVPAPAFVGPVGDSQWSRAIRLGRNRTSKSVSRESTAQRATISVSPYPFEPKNQQDFRLRSGFL